MILVVAPQEDAHTHALRHALAQMGAQVTDLDLAEFPQQAQVALNFDTRHQRYERLLCDYEGEVDLTDCGAVWWHQAQNFILHPELTDQIYRSFAYGECQATLTGLWLGLDATWVNHPLRCEEAQRKAYQLKIAQQCGFQIPATLITNNPSRARAFVQEHGAMHTTYQAFSASAHSWHEAALVESQQMALLDNVCYAPVVFQELIPAEAELRIVFIADNYFAVRSALAKSSTTAGMSMDFPVDLPVDLPELDMPAPYPVSPELAHQIELLRQRLGLIYGVIVMRISTSGQMLFQEIDPTGSWLGLEEATEMPITYALADLLMRADHMRPDIMCPDREKQLVVGQ